MANKEKQPKITDAQLLFEWTPSEEVEVDETHDDGNANAEDGLNDGNVDEVEEINEINEY